MTRSDLEHLIRAASAITGEKRFFVIGSQSILGSHPDAPKELLESYEADIIPVEHSENADLIEGSIGEESPFHRTFGYYAHGVAIEVAVLPDGWRDRVVELSNPNTGGATGLCLQVHDLAISKLAAGPEKDLAFVENLVKHRLTSTETMKSRLDGSSIDSELKRLIRGRIACVRGGAG